MLKRYVLLMILFGCSAQVVQGSNTAKKFPTKIFILRPEDMKIFCGKDIEFCLKSNSHPHITRRIDLSKQSNFFGRVEEQPEIGAVPFFRIRIFYDSDKGPDFIDVGPWFLEAYQIVAWVKIKD